MINWLDHLNREVMLPRNTRLAGGFPEPFYKAPSGEAPAEVQFTRDYERSALHELAHWCIAGESRRLQDDYGYWYEPDGRTGSQQQLFFEVEVRPQALEKHFCEALDIPFDVSVDNLGNTGVDGVDNFKNNVEQQYTRYTTTGLPERASVIYQCLQQWKLAQGRLDQSIKQGEVI
jgi:elongation factor P hydroxylase